MAQCPRTAHRRLVTAGAVHVDDRTMADESWVVLRDPAGMEFCVVWAHREQCAMQAVTVEE